MISLGWRPMTRRCLAFFSNSPELWDYPMLKQHWQIKSPLTCAWEAITKSLADGCTTLISWIMVAESDVTKGLQKGQVEYWGWGGERWWEGWKVSDARIWTSAWTCTWLELKPKKLLEVHCCAEYVLDWLVETKHIYGQLQNARERTSSTIDWFK
jgi:hypothetical protein